MIFTVRLDPVCEFIMSTTVDLSPEMLADVKALTRLEDDSAAIRQAMSEYVRYARRMALKAVSGKVEMQDNWSELEAIELRSQHGVN